MENNDNSSNNAAVLEELQTLNEGISSLNENQEELTEYIINKDKEEEELKAEQEEEQKIADEESEQIEQEEKEAQEADQETYTEIVSDIRDSINLNNHLLSGQIFFCGVIAGLLIIKILFDRFSTHI